MKISFLGAGAIGSMFGALLRHHAPELDIQLIVRGEHGDAIAEHGEVEIVGPFGTRQVQIAWSFDPRDVAGSDIVFLTVKSQGTEQALKQAGDALGDATVVSIQNGINDSKCGNYVTADRLVMGMTTTNMVVVRPGVVSMQLDGPTLFGPSQAANDESLEIDDRVQQVVRLLSRIDVPGLSFQSHPNILGVRYNKLTLNALGYASCLSASNFVTEALFHTDWRKDVGQPIVEECRKIFRSSGVEIAKIPGRSDLSRVENLMHALNLPILGKIVQLALRRKFTRSPIVFSLGQDLSRGKTTEVEYINGQIVQLAARSANSAEATDTPVNSEVVRLTHELEAQPAGSFFTRREVIDRVRRAQQP